MDSHLLVVSGVSSCRRSGCSEAEMNPEEAIATERVASPFQRRLPQQEQSTDIEDAINHINLRQYIDFHTRASFPFFRLPNTRLANPDSINQAAIHNSHTTIRQSKTTAGYKWLQDKIFSVARGALWARVAGGIACHELCVSYELLRKGY